MQVFKIRIDMGKIIITDDVKEIANLERLVITDINYTGSKHNYNNLIDMHIHLNSVFVANSKELYLVLPVSISNKITSKCVSLMLSECDVMFSHIEKNKVDYYLTPFDIRVLSSKCSMSNILENYITNMLGCHSPQYKNL